jgi:hypothetical protein
LTQQEKYKDLPPIESSVEVIKLLYANHEKPLHCLVMKDYGVALTLPGDHRLRSREKACSRDTPDDPALPPTPA